MGLRELDAPFQCFMSEYLILILANHRRCKGFGSNKSSLFIRFDEPKTAPWLQINLLSHTLRIAV